MEDDIKKNISEDDSVLDNMQRQIVLNTFSNLFTSIDSFSESEKQTTYQNMIAVFNTLLDTYRTYDDKNVSNLIDSVVGKHGKQSATSYQKIIHEQERNEFFVNFAHEINTYLTAILADAENIKVEAAPNSQISGIANHLFGQAQRLLIFTETIMGVISGTHTSDIIESTSLYRPLIEAIELFQDEAKFRGTKIILQQSSSEFPTIQMNLFNLTLAFKNIVHNAIKYSFTPPKGSDRYIKVAGKWFNENKTFYSISIQNYGVGITKDEIRRKLIFQPYYRGQLSNDRNRTGSGLGLAYAASVIEKHHGEMFVESRPVSENSQAYLTTFNIVLPVKQNVGVR